jgi:exoribonuclease-2
LPEGTVQLLPPEAVLTLGLGLQVISPALSFAITLDASAQITQVEVHPTWVRVTRMSYELAETQLEGAPFAGLLRIGRAYHNRRKAGGAMLIDLPEVMIRAQSGQVSIEPVTRLQSRDMVREAMLMAGEAAAMLAMEHNLPAPFVSQEPPASGLPSGGEEEPSLARRYAMRRGMRRSQVVGAPAPHAGVGLAAYCRVTSPLRRYLDLVAHQQLRAWLRGDPLIGRQAMFERLGASDAILAATMTAEQLSRRHWTLVYLLQNPDWRGEGVLVEASGTRATLLVPELALETPLHLRQPLPPDSRVMANVRDINLPELEVHFNIL